MSIAEDYHKAMMKELGDAGGTLSIFPESRTSALLEGSRSRARQRLVTIDDEETDYLERKIETHEHLEEVGKDGCIYERDQTQSKDQDGNEKHVIV